MSYVFPGRPADEYSIVIGMLTALGIIDQQIGGDELPLLLLFL